MRITIEGDDSKPRRGQRYLTAEAILRYLLEADDAIDTLIKCKPGGVSLISTDQSIYEALVSVKDYDSVNLRNLVKFLEVVDIVSYQEKFGQRRSILTERRVEELRKMALSKGGDVHKR